MSKILINNTASPIALSNGHTVPASGQYTIDPANAALFARAPDVWMKISAGDLTYNDGTSDLTLYEAFWHLADRFPQISGVIGPQGDTGPQGTAGVDGADGDTGPQGPQGVPGSGAEGGKLDYQEAAQSGEAYASSSSSWLDVLSMSYVTTEASAKYLIECAYLFNVSSNNKYGRWRILVNGSPLRTESQPEIRDDRWVDGFIKKSITLAAGTHAIKFQARHGSATAGTTEAFLTAERVG